MLLEVHKEETGRPSLVLLDACHTGDRARAIVDVVGCVIGTTASIKDEAAIAFSTTFYEMLASGRSVMAAFKHARAHVAMQIPGNEDSIVILNRADADPSRFVFAS